MINVVFTTKALLKADQYKRGTVKVWRLWHMVQFYYYLNAYSHVVFAYCLWGIEQGRVPLLYG